MNDPYAYMGSGVLWIKHLKKYGTSDIHTEILFETTSKDELREMGLYYSNLWNVVESDEFANLREESGDGWAPGRSLSKEHKEKLSMKASGSNNPMYGKDRSGDKNPMYGIRRYGIDSPNSKRVSIDDKIFDTCKDLAKYYNVSKSTVSRWIKQNKIKVIS